MFDGLKSKRSGLRQRREVASSSNQVAVRIVCVRVENTRAIHHTDKAVAGVIVAVFNLLLSRVDFGLYIHECPAAENSVNLRGNSNRLLCHVARRVMRVEVVGLRRTGDKMSSPASGSYVSIAGAISLMTR